MLYLFQIPYEKLVEIIKEKSGLSDSEIDSKVAEKLDQLSGLISKEGAAHIIANQLGVSLVDQSGGSIKIKNILSGMRNVETVGKVLGVYEVREFTNDKGNGKVGSFLIGDETGVLRVTCWHDQTDVMKEFKVGDIIQLQGGMARSNNDRIEVHTTGKTEFVLNPEGVSIDLPDNATASDMKRKQIVDLSGSDFNVEVLATVVQVFNPTFFEVCPTCGKRARLNEDKHVCAEHGAVEPEFSYVLNCVVDDGTGTLRCVFFREQALKLIGKTHEDMLHYKEIPEKVEELKTTMLGQLVKLGGKVNKNEMFDRLEFNVRQVDPNPDPNAELKRLEQDQ